MFCCPSTKKIQGKVFEEQVWFWVQAGGCCEAMKSLVQRRLCVYMYTHEHI